MSDGLQMFLLLVLAPFVVGIAMLLVTRRLKGDWARMVVGLVGTGSLLVGAFYLVATGPYMWTLHLESKWRPANPQTLLELESMLSGYTKKDILPAQSGWRRDHRLEPGERMIRYSLLGAPLDVVFTREDRIAAIYTSYE
jgi:hypothetical protein